MNAELMLHWAQHYIKTVDLFQSLSHINITTLLIDGDSDPLSDNQQKQEITNALPHCSFFELSNTGHYAPIYRAEEIVSAIMSWNHLRSA